MGIKLSAHQQNALFLIAGKTAQSTNSGRSRHIGKRTWHALEKKGVVERSPSADGYLHWRLTAYGWTKLKEIHEKRKRAHLD